MIRSFALYLVVSLLILPFSFQSKPVLAEERSGAVIAPFQQEDLEKHRGNRNSEEDQWKHEILFYMGVLLLLLIFTTAGFGLAMAVKGKDVFIQHMISAGLTVFLSLAHAVAAVVWFFPF